MKKQTKKTIIISAVIVIVIVALILLVAALQKDVYGYNWFDRNKKVVETEDHSVNFGDYKFQYIQYINSNSQFSIFAQYGIRPSDEILAQIRSDVLENSMLQYLYADKAKELGLELTAEQETVIKNAGKRAVAALKQEILDANASITTDAQAEAQLVDYFKNMGISRSGYMKAQVRGARASYMSTAVLGYYEENNIYSDAQIEEQYDKYVEEYFSSYTPGIYSQYETAFQSGNNAYRYLNIPEDFLFVRVIKVSTEEDMNALVGRLDSGEDFETLLQEEINEDKFIKTMDAEEGYAIGPKDSFMNDNDQIYNAAKELEIGEYSTTVVTTTTKNEDDEDVESSVYYIFKRVDGQTGKVPYETYADVFKSNMIFLRLNEELLAEVQYSNEALLIDLENVMFGMPKSAEDHEEHD